MKAAFILILFLFSFQVLAQTDEQVNRSGVIKLIFAEDTKKARELAEKDIVEGLPFLVLQSGISPVVYSSDKEFERKYKVYYYEEGCTGAEIDKAIAYNHRIFSYLTQLYGDKWKKNIRKDVIGFKEWKKSN